MIFCHHYILFIIFLFIDHPVPDESDFVFRSIIKELFVIHGETKLDMICVVGRDPERYYGHPFSNPWCRGLNHPSISSTTSQVSTTLNTLTLT